MNGNKLKIILILLITSFSISSCTGSLVSLEPKSLSQLESVKLLFTTVDYELVILHQENEKLIFPDEASTRWTYSEKNNILFKNLGPAIPITGYVNTEEIVVFGRNYDECGGGSLILDDQLFLYIADEAILDGGEDPSGSLLLMQYGITSGNKILYEFPFKANELIQPERCFLGTNSEYDGIVYFADKEDGTSVVRKMELATGEIGTVFSDEIIMAPSISPQGDMIAYTKYDGIYGYDLIANEKMKLVDVPWIDERSFYFDQFSYHALYQFIPIVSWLPSGSQFGYHVVDFYTDVETGERTKDYDIYVYNFSTETSELFMENALSPYWVLP